MTKGEMRTVSYALHKLAQVEATINNVKVFQALEEAGDSELITLRHLHEGMLEMTDLIRSHLIRSITLDGEVREKERTRNAESED